jgi:hypothetical protein
MSTYSDLPTCSVPASVTISGTTAVKATLTVNTTPPTSAALKLPLYRLLAGGGGDALALVFLFGIPARRRTWQVLLSLLAVVFMAGAIGCGSGGGVSSSSSGGGTSNPGTTAGNYTITVTGTDAATGKITSSTAVSLTVN